MFYAHANIYFASERLSASTPFVTSGWTYALNGIYRRVVRSLLILFLESAIVTRDVALNR